MCNKPWYKGFDPVLFSGIYSDYEIMMDTVEVNYDKNCSNDEMVYVSNPSNVLYTDVIVEVWGKE